MLYDSAEYAQSRLIHTVVRLKDNTLIKVNGVIGNRNNMMVHYNTIADEVFGEIPLQDCNLNPTPLGNMNFKRHKMCGYISRIPKRNDWRQGLRAQNMKVSNIRYPKYIFEEGKAFQECVDNKYPLYEDAINFLRKNVENRSIAFSRKFSINRYGNSMQIFYKTNKVGKILQKDYRLDVNFKHLKEQLEMAINV